MQVIVKAKYLGPTNHHGSRYSITNISEGTRSVVSYNYTAINARTAAIAEVLGVADSAIEYHGEIGDVTFHIVTK